MSLRLLLVAPLLPPLHSGAGLQAVRWIGRRADALETTALTLGRADLPGEEERDGMHLVRVGSVTASRPARAFGLHASRRLPSLMAGHDVTLVLGVAPVTYSALLVGRVRRHPVVVKLTLEGEDDPATLAARPLGRRRLDLLRSAAAVVTPSQRLGELCAIHGFPTDRLHEIPNGVDVERFAPPVEPGPVTEGAYVGAVERRKNVHLLLDAVERLAPDHPDVLLHVVGGDGRTDEDAAYAADLRRRAERAPLAGRVRFHGRLDEPERVLAGCGVFLLPSAAEGLPNALLEGMAVGLAPLASDLAGVREVVHHGRTGVVVTGADGAAWAAAWHDRMTAPDETREMGERARGVITDRYDLDETADRYAVLLRRVAEGKA